MKLPLGLGLGLGLGLFALISTVVISVVATLPADAGPLNGPWDNIRLPENIHARKYRMYLDINWQDMDYRGTNEVTMDVTGEDTRYFLIHSRGLEIDRAATTLSAVGEDGEETPLTVMRSFMDKDKKPDQNHDFYVVESKSAVAAGTYKMKISFSGKVQTNRLTGMYRSKYTRKLPGREPDSAVIYQISTDFEPVDARTAFPCFDEPAQKAKWETDISVTFPAGINPDEYNIISNMPLKDKYITNDQTLSGAFKESIEMSTYLVCFAVSDFHYQEGVYTRDDNSTVALRVFARREDNFQETAKYAVKVTSPILKKYEEFYKVRFPLPKLDQIALPEFNSGAMENWGIITYRESSLLYDPVKSSNNEKQRVCAVIAHEIAHQWFGNTVTMDWWNDLWLNEGFASFVEYYGIDAAEPKWNILNFFYPDEVTTAMNFDSSPSSHPISVNVSSPDELNGLFDTISYRKGSSINWMMLKFIGEEKFKEGLQIYIERHQGGNAKMVELFDALNEAADDNIDVKEIMMTWTMQMGFPLVTVSLDTSTAGKTKISVSQERFLVGEASEEDHSDYGYKWWVPFTYVTVGTPQSAITWMDPDNNEGSAEVVVDGTLTWVKGNADGNYYYITNYDESVWGQLKTEIEKTGNGALSNTNDRTSLIYDAFRLAEIGKVGYDIALDMTLYSTNEQEYVVLSRVLGEVLKAADKIQEDPAAYTKSKEYVKKMLKPRVDELGWISEADEPITAPKLRDMAIRNYCKAVDDSNDATVREALEKFADFAAHTDDVKPEIKDVFTTVLRTAILYDDDENKNWHKMWNLLQTSDWEADQRIYIAALARTTNQDLLRKMISESWEPETKGDPWRYLYYVNFQGDNYDLGWEILKQDWNKYAEKYNGTSFTMGYLIEIPEAFETQEKYDEVKAFFESKADNIGSGLKTVAETLAKIKSNIEWSKNYASTVTDWFKQLP